MKYFTLSLLLLSVCTINAGSKPSISKNDLPTAVVTTGGAFTNNAQIFEDSLQSLYTSINLAKYDLSFEAFRYAMIGYYSLAGQHKLNDTGLVSIIDFTKP